jgi:hypothetical protein
METLNLKKLWEICNILSDKQNEFHEQGIYIYFMGRSSEYNSMSFESFLDYYSFKIIKDVNEVLVFNNDPISWENYSTNDFSYVPLNLLLGGEKALEEYLKNETEKQLEQIEKDKIALKEKVKKDIEKLTNKLKTL